MKHRYHLLLLPAILAVSAVLFFRGEGNENKSIASSLHSLKKKKKDPEVKYRYAIARRKYEYDLIKDPGTGRLPVNILAREREQAKMVMTRTGGRNGAYEENLNSYVPAGPDSIGGRTRALAIDMRYDGSGNKVMLSGSVSGGIFRSTDGGNTWTRVSPENDVHVLSSIAQDPRAGNQNTWYAGGGEPVGNSASEDGALFLGHGIWKSTDNGLTWTKLTLIVNDGGTVLGGGSLEGFDNVFDFVHKIIVNPANGHVYVAGHRRLVRSTDGGQSWHLVFTTIKPLGTASGQMDIAVTPSGRLFLAVNGAVRDHNLRGLWTSTTGDKNAWTRIAGGKTLGVDSVAGWRGNSYSVESVDNSTVPADTSFAPKRIIMSTAPSDPNLLYIMYENGLSQEGSNPLPEVDLFKLNFGTNPVSWTNLSPNMPDFPGQMSGVDPLETQGGFNMSLTVKPDDANAVFIGATNLYRSTSGFTNTSATSWIGGYNQDFASGLRIYPASHPDFHNLAFFPNNNNFNPGYKKAIAANDGGLQITTDIMKAGAVQPVSWSMVKRYQTLQYYHIALDPTPGQLNFIGGAQDNGTQVRLEGDNFHIRIISGDGGAAAIGKLTNTQFTLYGSTQLGATYRYREGENNFKEITPSNLTPFPGMSEAYGEFVTYFKLDQENPENIYYANFNRLFRTTDATNVAAGTWTELTGVRARINPTNPTGGTNIGIRALETSRGPYTADHVLYIGTSNGKVFRLNDPKNAPANTSPVDITPPELEAYRTAGAGVNVADIAVNPNNDNEIMLVVSNYSVTVAGQQKNDFNVWWTNNAKSAAPTWKKAEGNLTLPSMRSCMIIVKKEGGTSVTEYYVGTSVGLYSAKNIGTTLLGGGNVEWVREGGNVLNYSVISSMDYRPADNILLLGTHGNGAYLSQLGTPDFRPNLGTGINDPIRNDKNFIAQSSPTLVKNTINYTVGNMYELKKIIIAVHNLNGQTLVRKEVNYVNGQLNIDPLPKGAYVLSITSADYTQQYVRKFIKE